MSAVMGNSKSKTASSSKSIPAPPPPPPPPLPAQSGERVRGPKLKTKELFNRKNASKTESKKSGGKAVGGSSPQVGSTRQSQSGSILETRSKKTPSKVSKKASPQSQLGSKKAIPLPPPEASSENSGTSDQESDDQVRPVKSVKSAPSKRKPTSRQEIHSRLEEPEYSSVIEISRNDVPFFDEDLCTDAEDEFSFPCCLQPNSPRYPPNPRPYREWDPAFLPSSVNIPNSIGRKCRRCGKPVYVAELYMSSRGVYHSECFKCCLCGKSLDSWSMSEFKGEVFCKGCYRRNFGSHGVGFGVGAGVLQTP